MQLGISNSSAFIGLGRIGRLDLLGGHFQRIVVPGAVAAEVVELPTWVEVLAVDDPRMVEAFPSRIHRGEAEVILLGLQHHGAVLVLDDWFARGFALARGLRVVGTVGLLLRAKRDSRIAAINPVLQQLVAAGFHLFERVRRDALRLAGEE